MSIDPAELIAAIQQSDATDLAALLTAKENAKRNMLDDPSAANVQAFERSKRALDGFMRPDEDPDEPQRVFRNRIEALAHLHAQGYAIQKTKLYADCKAGHLRLQADKSITEADLERYVKRMGLAKPSEAADNGAQHARKLELEIVRLQQDIREKDFKLAVAEGKYIARDAVQMEIASHAALFDAGISHAVETRAAACEEALHLIPEKHERVAYIRRWFREFLGEQLNEFANLKSYQVLMLDTAAELEDAGA